MKKIGLLPLVFSLILITYFDARACGCAGRVDNIEEAVSKDFKQASVVFSGKLIAREWVPLNSKDAAGKEIKTQGLVFVKRLVYRFAVDTWWKGKPENEIILDSSGIIVGSMGSSSNCDYSFTVNKNYLVYASALTICF